MSAAWKRQKRGNHQSGEETRETSAGLDTEGDESWPIRRKSEAREEKRETREAEKPRKPRAKDA